MVRSVREPNLVTPHRPRVSTGSTTTPSRGLPSPLFCLPNIDLNASIISLGSGKKRSALGERSDNVIMPENNNAGKPVQVGAKNGRISQAAATPKTVAKKFSSLVASSSPIPSPPRSLMSTPRTPHSSPRRDDDVPTPFNTAHNPRPRLSRPISTPYPKLTHNRASLPLRYNEEETMLINAKMNDLEGLSDTESENDANDHDMTDPDSLGRGNTSGSSGRSQLSGQAVRGAGRMMTPDNSQEDSNLSRFIHSASSPPMTQKIRPFSRLPTPPSSQNSTEIEAGSSSKTSHRLPPPPTVAPRSNVRARPSNTPPRRLSTAPDSHAMIKQNASLWSNTSAADDPSPNPRRKKTPRFSGTNSVPEQMDHPSNPGTLKKRPVDRVEVVITSRSSTPRSSTPATRAKFTKSTSRRTSTGLSLSQMSTLAKSPGAAHPLHKTPKAAAPLHRTPATAPAGNRRNTSSLSVSTTRKSAQTPKTVNSKSRRASTAFNLTKMPRTPRASSLTISTMGGKSRIRQSMTPSVIRVLNTVGVAPKPIEGSPGDDPLLLKGFDEDLGVWPEKAPVLGLGLEWDDGDDFMDSGLRYDRHSGLEEVEAGPSTSNKDHEDSPQLASETSTHGDIVREGTKQSSSNGEVIIHSEVPQESYGYDPAFDYLSDDDTVIHSDGEESESGVWGGDDTFMNIASRRLGDHLGSFSSTGLNIASGNPTFRPTPSKPPRQHTDDVDYDHGEGDRDRDGFSSDDAQENRNNEDAADDWGMGEDTLIRLMRPACSDIRQISPIPVGSIAKMDLVSPAAISTASSTSPVRLAPSPICPPGSDLLSVEEGQRVGDNSQLPTSLDEFDGEANGVLDDRDAEASGLALEFNTYNDNSVDQTKLQRPASPPYTEVDDFSENQEIGRKASRSPDIPDPQSECHDESIQLIVKALRRSSSVSRASTIAPPQAAHCDQSVQPLSLIAENDGAPVAPPVVAETVTETDVQCVQDEGTTLRSIVVLQTVIESEGTVFASEASKCPASPMKVVSVEDEERLPLSHAIEGTVERAEGQTNEATVFGPASSKIAVSANDGPSETLKTVSLQDSPVIKPGLEEQFLGLPLFSLPNATVYPKIPLDVQHRVADNSAISQEATLNEEDDVAGSQEGNTTIEADSTWDLSDADMLPPVIDEPAKNIHLPVTSVVTPRPDWSSYPSHDQTKNPLAGAVHEVEKWKGNSAMEGQSQADQEEIDESNKVGEQVEEEKECALSPMRQSPERIVIKLCPRVVKVESNEDHSPIALESSPLQDDVIIYPSLDSPKPSQSVFNAESRSFVPSVPNSTSTSLSTDHVKTSFATATSLTSTDIQPVPEFTEARGPISTDDLKTSSNPREPSAFLFANKTSNGIAVLEDLQERRARSSAKPGGPSRLANQSTGETSIAPSEIRSEKADDPRPRESGTPYLSKLQGRRSLHDQLVSASSLEEDEDDGNDSIRSVVEVSSLDPRAAARAAAILKLNHAYIEHGVLPPHSTPESQSIPLPNPTYSHRSDRSTKSHRKRRSQSAHFASIESASKLNKDQLLHEAELEIVASRRSRTRSISRNRNDEHSDAETEIYLPGGYVHTPGKRKRKSLHPSQTDVLKTLAVTKSGKAGKAWGVAEWKKLEKVLKAERDLWVNEREIKALPVGFMAWAGRGALSAGEPKAKEWDGMRVVDRFLKESGVKEDELVGEWERSIISLRVQALERKIAKELSTQTPTATSGSSNASRTECSQTPAKSSSSGVVAEPPSTVRRMLGYIFPGFSSHKPVVKSLLPTHAVEKDEINKSESQLLTKLRDARNSTPAQSAVRVSATHAKDGVPMREIGTSKALADRSTISWTASDPPSTLSRFYPTLVTEARPALPTLTSTPVNPQGSLYPSLNPPFTQRSSAIKALFPDAALNSSTASLSRISSNSLAGTSSSSTVSSNRPVPIPIPLRSVKSSGSVKDLVKSFEEQGVLSRSLEKSSAQNNSLRSSKGSLSRF